MSNLISWQTYCNVTSTATNSPNQTLIENLIVIASDTIENYCDRTFSEENYYEWKIGRAHV